MLKRLDLHNQDKNFWLGSLISVMLSIVAIYYATYYYRVHIHGIETSATVETVYIYKYPNKEKDYYELTAKYLDKNNNVVISKDIKTRINVHEGEKIKILYNRYSPEIADIKDNNLTKINFWLYFGSAIFLSCCTAYVYRENKQKHN